MSSPILLFVAVLVVILVAGLGYALRAFLLLRKEGDAMEFITACGWPGEQGTGTAWEDLAKRLTASSKFGTAKEDLTRVLQQAENTISQRIEFCRVSSNIAVYIGLLGTLLGLSVSVGHLGRIDAKAPSEFTAVAVETVRGFNGAFYSAMAGVTVTIILAAIVSLYSRYALSLVDRMESQATTQVEESVSKSPAAASPAEQLAQASGTFARELTGVLSQFGQRAGGILQNCVEAANRLEAQTRASAESLSVTTASLLEAAKGAEAAGGAAGEVITGARDLNIEAREIIRELSSARDLKSQVLELRQILSELSSAVSGAPAVMKDTSQSLERASRELITLKDQMANVVNDGLLREERFRATVVSQFDEFEKSHQEVWASLQQTLALHHEYAVQVSRVVAGLMDAPPTVSPAPETPDIAPEAPIFFESTAQPSPDGLLPEIHRLNETMLQVLEAIKRQGATRIVPANLHASTGATNGGRGSVRRTFRERISEALDNWRNRSR